MKQPLPLLVCGAGRVLEALYAPALARSSAFRPAAVVDPRPERRAWAERALGVPAYASIDAALAGPTVAAALVLTPPSAQAESTRGLLLRGVAVLTEKPGSRSLREAQSLVEAAAARPLRLALSRRFWPRYVRLQASLTGVPGRWAVRIETDPRAWSPVEPSSGEALTALIDDLLPHAYDLACHVLGADVSSPRTARWDGARLVVRFGRSDLGSIEIGHGDPWRESVSYGATPVSRPLTVAAGGGTLGRLAALPSLAVRATRRTPSEPVQAIEALLADFAVDVEAGRGNDDLVACARLIEQVQGLVGS